MLQITESASQKINELIEVNSTKKNITKDEMFLRIYIAGGGCSGIQFGMALTSSKRDDDIVQTVNDIQVIIDPTSSMYLDGAEVDFIHHELGDRFKITPSEQIDLGGGCSSCGPGGCS